MPATATQRPKVENSAGRRRSPRKHEYGRYADGSRTQRPRGTRRPQTPCSYWRPTAQFDVVVTDYAMPGMNGLDLATRVKRIQPQLPIVLATGYAELPPHAAVEFPRVGKPYTQQELAVALESALNTRGSEG